MPILFSPSSHPTLSHSITSPDPALSPPSLSNRPLSSEGWVLIWVYFGVGSVRGSGDGVGRGYGGVVGRSEVGRCEVGRGNLGCGEVGHELTAEVSGF